MAKKFLIVLLTILLLAAMGAGGYFLWEQNRLEKQEAERLEEINARIYAETLPLVEQRKVLREQVEEMEAQINAIHVGTGTVQYLVTDLSDRMYSQVISIMLEREAKAVLGLSMQQFPGLENCMTAEQAMEAIEYGWTFCYSFNRKEADKLSTDRTEAFSLWLEFVSQAAVDAGITVEGAVLFPTGSFSEEYIPVLQRKGIDVVIHHGEIKQGEIVHTIYTADETDGLWYVGAAWWWRNGIASGKFSRVAATGGNLVVEIGTQDFGTVNPKTGFDAFDKAEENMSLMPTGFEGMKQQQRKNRLGDAEAEQKLQEQIDELNAQIDELSRQIQRIGNRYLADASSAE